MPNLLFALTNGELLDYPQLAATAASHTHLVAGEEIRWIPLPEGATLTMMPNCLPKGIDKKTGGSKILKFNPYNRKKEAVCAVAALLPQGFTRTHLPAFKGQGDILPLFGYTAAAIEGDTILVAARQTDDYDKWNPCHYNTADLEKKVAKIRKELPHNPIIKQLAKCSLEYSCFTAQNIFYRRWEGGIPVSHNCNANCLGCISLQQSQCCPSPQQRIDFLPTATEIAQMAIPHLEEASEGIVSFGQGCEGEPSQEWPTIVQAIQQIRAKTSKGLINMNTNGGNTKAIEKIAAAGIDLFRFSLFSAQDQYYNAYHRPIGYTLDNVKASLKIAAQYQIHTSLNLLTYPGFTDTEEEITALSQLIEECDIQQIQFRNLNIDPRLMNEFCQSQATIGINGLLDLLKQKYPQLILSSFSHYIK